MSALASSAISVIDSAHLGTVSGKSLERRDRVVLTLSSQGASAGDITAAMLGFAEIYSVFAYRFVASGEKIIAVSTDGTNIFTYVALNAAPANATGDLYLEIAGRTL